MKIAVTYENGQIFQHFGHTERFAIYDAENGSIISRNIVDTNGSGHGALADFLKGNGVEALICGGIGGGARQALDAVGIRLYAGASGSADEAVKSLLAGSLSYDPDTVCTDHEHGHHGSCGEHGHGCGGHGHGCNH